MTNTPRDFSRRSLLLGTGLVGMGNLSPGCRASAHCPVPPTKCLPRDDAVEYCPDHRIITSGGVYYYFYLGYYDPSCLATGSSRVATSLDDLSMNPCQSNPDCTAARKGDWPDPIPHKTRCHKIAVKQGVPHPKDPRKDGLYHFHGSVDVIQPIPGRLWVLECGLYQVALDTGTGPPQVVPGLNLVQVYLLAYSPKHNGKGNSDVIFGIGQETAEKASGAVRTLVHDAGIPRAPGDKYFACFRQSDNLYFHILTKTKPCL
jgi:hypothetical protein